MLVSYKCFEVKGLKVNMIIPVPRVMYVMLSEKDIVV
jgi:hypothetical protein